MLYNIKSMDCQKTRNVSNYLYMEGISETKDNMLKYQGLQVLKRSAIGIPPEIVVHMATHWVTSQGFSNPMASNMVVIVLTIATPPAEIVGHMVTH
uniref:Uncharacterized protein n=1 Tax=Romanomermis culicivorax TaxID=13658 RepID=A0A915J4D2_ROMCU